MKSSLRLGLVHSSMFAPSAFLFLLALTSQAQVQPTALRLEPRGTSALGTTSTYMQFNSSTQHNECHFKYDGSAVADENLEYVIDLDDADVKTGLLRVYEATTGSLPIFEGGLAWRLGPNSPPESLYDVQSPRGHHDAAMLVSPVMVIHQFLNPTSKVLTLKYKEARTYGAPPNQVTVEARKTYEFWLVGKVLKIHAFADPSVNSSWLNNYTSFWPGRSAQVPGAAEQHVPYMDNVIVVRFNPTPTSTAFYSVSTDYYRSNGVAYSHVGVGALPNSWDHWYPTYTVRSSAFLSPPYQDRALANVDETLNLIVTRKIDHTFPVIANYRSPYYDLTSGRMMIFGGRQNPNAWKEYKQQYDSFKAWGLTDLSIIQYASHKWGLVPLFYPTISSTDYAGIMGCEASSILAGPTPIHNVPGYGDVYPVDPDATANKDRANLEFGALATSARGLGAVFATRDCENTIDQWSTGEYHWPSQNPSVPSYNNNYPVGVWPLTQGWFNGTHFIGLAAAGAQTAFYTNWPTRRAEQYLPMSPIWDTGYNTPGTSWEHYGFRTGTVDAQHIRELLQVELEYGKLNYQANAINYDAAHFIPYGGYVDATTDASKTHTAADYLISRTKATRMLRDYVGGPIYGEEAHWRQYQSYEYGVRDGFRHAFPTDESENGSLNWEDHKSWVIPDYNLREVLPKSAGNSGMGDEVLFMDYKKPANGIDGPPFDHQDGNFGGWIDPWIATCATYGQNPFVSSNGHTQWSAVTYEAVIREYAMLAGLARRMREGKILQVVYFGPGPSYTPYDLAGALAAGVDLKNPRIELVFDNGLQLYANHDVAGGSDWQVSVPNVTGTLVAVTLKPNGFAAGDGSQLFEFFNGTPVVGGYSHPFDYVKYVGRWEALTNRANDCPGCSVPVDVDYDGFPASVIGAFTAADQDLFREATIYCDFRKGAVLGAHGGLPDSNGGWITVTSSPTLPNDDVGTPSKVTVVTPQFLPAPVDLSVQSSAQVLYTNKPEGVTARMVFPNGSWQDVTTLCAWTCSGNCSVNQSGVVTASSGTSATVTATYSSFQKNISFAVASGLPVANAGADVTVMPGGPVVFDAASAGDPKGGPVRIQWDFGDGVKVLGRKVSHVFTESLPRTVTLTVRDVEENESSATSSVTVDWSNSNLWWDSFDDGTLDGYGQLAGDLWGINQGLLQQFKLSSGTEQLTIAGSTHVWSDSSTGMEFRNLVGAGTIGIHTRMTNESDLPSQSGYRVTVDSGGVIILREAGTGGVAGSGSVSQFNSSIRHDLRLVTRLVGLSTISRVYVDGVRYVEVADSTPPAAGYAGITTASNAQGQFEDLRVGRVNAPYVTAVPLEFVAGQPATFYIDHQDNFSSIDTNSMKLTIKAEDGPAAGQTLTYQGLLNIATVATLPTLTYEHSNENDSTWAKITMKRRIGLQMDDFNTQTKSISYELVVSDVSAKTTRKFVRYTRP